MYYLGIDPGLSEVGFGIVELGSTHPDFVDCGIIRTAAGLPLAERLHTIKTDLGHILDQHRFEAVGVEELFFVKNVTNGIKVAHARGIILESLQERGLPIYEMKPTELKSNLCGDGQADKKQVQTMVQRLLNLNILPRPHDAADALGIAILTSRLHKR